MRLQPTQWFSTQFALVAGAVLFCGSSLQAILHDVVVLAAFCAAIALLGAAALHLRKAFSDALARSGRTCRENLWKEIVADGLLTVVLALAALWICTYAFDHAHDALEWPAAFLYFGVLATCVRLLRDRNRSLSQMREAAAPPPQQAAGAPAPSALLHYVEAEDHYVKLVYSDRVEHKRARFSDVIDSLGDAGLRVHKSFWVNRHFVTGTRRAGRRLVLVLKDGVEIPVGRSNERKVVDALALSPAVPPYAIPAAAGDGIRPGPVPPAA